jgi:hypothetical protein
MSEQTLTLTGAEKEGLVHLLEKALKEAQIEEHRTRAPSFREYVLKQEELITSVLGKLGHKPA